MHHTFLISKESSYQSFFFLSYHANFIYINLTQSSNHVKDPKVKWSNVKVIFANLALKWQPKEEFYRHIFPKKVSPVSLLSNFIHFFCEHSFTLSISSSYISGSSGLECSLQARKKMHWERQDTVSVQFTVSLIFALRVIHFRLFCLMQNWWLCFDGHRRYLLKKFASIHVNALSWNCG